MPRQQTYGKRSRTIYDPRAAPATWSSPETATERSIEPIQETDGETNSRSDQACTAKTIRARKILGEKNGNDGSTHHSSSPKKPLQRRRARKIVLDEEDTENISPGIDGEDNVTKIQLPKVQQDDENNGKEVVLRRSPRKAKSRQRIKTGSAEALSVPAMKTTNSSQSASVDLENSHVKHHKFTVEKSSNASNDLSPEISEQETTSSPTVEVIDPYQSHLSPLLSQSPHPLSSFETWTTELSTHFQISKIAEASFGEVYRLSLTTPTSQDHTSSISNPNPSESVIKIIALTPPPSSIPKNKRHAKSLLKKSSSMSTPHSVSSEVRLLSRMSSVPGFTNFRDLRLLRGRPGEAFVRAFRNFDRESKAKGGEGTFFPDPGKKASYGDDQLWAAIEMQDAGRDLEKMVEEGECGDLGIVWDCFWQVVLSLAKGEGEAEFEHRDLHLGNICVRSRVGGKGDGGGQGMGRKKKVGFTGLETTIIDYTLSRARMSLPEERLDDWEEKEDVAYHDLSSDPAVFEGDATDEYQYDIYRFMRSALFLDRPLAAYTESTPEVTQRSWRQYHPKTNLVWLHLVLVKLLEQVVWPSARDKRRRKKTGKKAEEASQEHAFGHALRQISVILEPANIGCGNGIESVGDLVHLAIAEAWIDVEDVMGEDLVDDEDLVAKLQELEMGS